MSDYCAYPPQIAADFEVCEERDGDRSVFIAGSLAAGRFIRIGETEERVRRLIDGCATPSDIRGEFQRSYRAALSQAVLEKFLTKLDDVGILAGERARRSLSADQQPNAQFYIRIKLFNPDRLFTWIASRLRWVWTPGFVAATVTLMLAAILAGLMNGAELTSYSFYVVREHYVTLFIAGELIALSHEFAHGLTCKAFGGRVPEIGMLQIYYVIPALYCNVSGIHLIPQRSRRLWVILAGIYWQVLVGVVALLSWLVLAPYTLPSDLAFCFFLAGVVDVIFNANPLIKLDGYYFLSQWLRLPNLMDRSRACWRGLLRRTVLGEKSHTSAKYNRRERTIYFVYGLLSFVYTVGLRAVIVCVAGVYLIDRFHLMGLLLTTCLALFYMRRPLQQWISSLTSHSAKLLTVVFKKRQEDIMATENIAGEGARHRRLWRRYAVPVASLLLAGATLLAPWNASVGNYGALVAVPTKETIIRAPEAGTLVELRVHPGALVPAGAVVGRMSNLELDEQLLQIKADLVRADTNYARLLGELSAGNESVAHTDLLLRQRQNDFDALDSEQRQVQQHRLEMAAATNRPLLTTIALRSTANLPDRIATPYPPAMSVLQSEIDARRAQLERAGIDRDRAHKLFVEGLLPRNELDAAEARAATLSSELAGAHQRLEAALIEHGRKLTRSETDVDLARSERIAGRLAIDRLRNELQGTRQLIATLAERRDLLERKGAQFNLVTPLEGSVFGEDLPRMLGRYFEKGQEIFRIADASHLILRIQVPEREIGDVNLGAGVRLKTRSFPDHVFQGVVSTIGGESEQDRYEQPSYRVELTIENKNGMLRPGMTAFARIDFGRRTVGRILLHKVKQLLRPEMWLL